MMRHTNEVTTSNSISPVNTFLHVVPMTRKEKTPLPANYIPHSYSVILGRGKVNETVGNRRLKILVDIELSNYVKAQSRRDKGFVVARVMETIQDAGGAFIRHEDGLYYEVCDSEAREKISTIFRDKLSHQYKSSTSNKVKRRRRKKEGMRSSSASTVQTEERKPLPLVDMHLTERHTPYNADNSFSDCSSTVSV